jgi:hypothetical protein
MLRLKDISQLRNETIGLLGLLTLSGSTIYLLSIDFFLTLKGRAEAP